MLTLAVVMLVDPALMGSLGSSLLVFAAAVAATALVSEGVVYSPLVVVACAARRRLAK